MLGIDANAPSLQLVGEQLAGVVVHLLLAIGNVDTKLAVELILSRLFSTVMLFLFVRSPSFYNLHLLLTTTGV
jgi:hypothetical protein